MNALRSTSSALVLSLAAMAPGLSVAADSALDQAEPWLGGYRLADGRTLVIVQRGQDLLAQVDRRHEFVLQPAGETRLVSDDGRLTIDFNVAANGSASGVSVTMPAGSGLGVRARGD